MHVRILAAGFRARFAKNVGPIKSEGAGNAGRSMRPQPGGQKNSAAPVVIVTTVTPETPGIPRAMVYSLLHALPGEPGLFATVAGRICIHRLDTSVGVSGPHDFALRLRRLRLRHHRRPSHPAPRR